MLRRQTPGMLALGLALVLTAQQASGQEEPATTRLVAIGENGRTTLFVVDTEAKRLLVYQHVAGERLRLDAVRDYSYDLEFHQHGVRQRPSVKDVRKLVRSKRNTPERPPGLPGLIERELEIRALRQVLGAVLAGQPEPTVRGVPARSRLKALERDSLELRLSLVGDGGWPAFQEAFVATIRRRRESVGKQIDLRTALRERLPQDHGGRPSLERQLDELRDAQHALDLLERAEAPAEPPAKDE